MWWAKEKISDNPDENILKLYNVLAHVPFAASKLKLDIKYNNPGIQVALQNDKQIKT